MSTVDDTVSNNPGSATDLSPIAKETESSTHGKETENESQSDVESQEPLHRKKVVVRVASRGWHSQRIHRKRLYWLCGSINRKRLFDYGFCHRCRSKAKPLILILPIKSLDNLLQNDGPFAFQQLESSVVDFLKQKTWDEIVSRQEVHLLVHSLEPKDKDRLLELKLAVQNTFRFAKKMVDYEAARTLSEGLTSVWISIIAIACVLAVILPVILNIKEDDPLVRLLTSIPVIIIWVAVWHPVELLLYGRSMLKQESNVCVALSECNVILKIIGEKLPDEGEMSGN